VSGLAELPGDEPPALIRAVMAKADEDLRVHCEVVLARRGREGDRRWTS